MDILRAMYLYVNLSRRLRRGYRSTNVLWPLSTWQMGQAADPKSSQRERQVEKYRSIGIRVSSPIHPSPSQAKELSPQSEQMNRVITPSKLSHLTHLFINPLLSTSSTEPIEKGKCPRFIKSQIRLSLRNGIVELPKQKLPKHQQNEEDVVSRNMART